MDAQQEWVYLGEIVMQPKDKRADLYVKVIDRVSFYRVETDGNNYAVTKNPYYGNQNDWRRFYSHTANGFYFNVPN